MGLGDSQHRFRTQGATLGPPPKLQPVRDVQRRQFPPSTEPALADAAFRADVIERIAALHWIGEPMEVAGAVVFLASPTASLITGHDHPHRRRTDGAVGEHAAPLCYWPAARGGAGRSCRVGDPRRHRA